MPPISCIVYDLDGTLIDSAADIAAAINRVRQHYDLPPLDLDVVRRFIGNGATRLIERAIYGLTEDPADRPARRLPRSAVAKEEVLAHFRSVYKEDPLVTTTLYPGAEIAIRYWRQQGVAQVVLTNKPIDIARDVLDGLGMTPLLDLVLGRGSRDDGGHELPAKPDPALVEFILEQTGAPREETWIIGDGVPDVELALAAGIPYVAILGGYGPPKALLAAGADPACAVKDIREADALLRQLHTSP